MKSMKKFRCEPASIDEALDLPIGGLIGFEPLTLRSLVFSLFNPLTPGSDQFINSPTISIHCQADR